MMTTLSMTTPARADDGWAASRWSGVTVATGTATAPTVPPVTVATTGRARLIVRFLGARPRGT
jgi:hypothetical protein